jgi:putative aldouronate transport system substrate-binding protein
MTMDKWRKPGKGLAVGIAVLTAAAAFMLQTGCRRQAEIAASADTVPHIQFMLVLNGTEQPLPGIAPELEKATGTKLSFTWVPENIYSDKMASAIAGGALPDVLSVKAVDAKHPSVVNGIRSGLFWEIGPYLSQYPNLAKHVNPDIMRNGAYFGKEYGLYWERPISRQGIQYRKDWLDRLGLTEPHTIEELYAVLKAFTEDDPDGNGKQDTYGLMDRNDLVFGAFKNIAVYLGAPNGWGLVDGRLTPDFMTEEYRSAMLFMKQLYDEGILNPDFAVTSKAQQEDRFVQGEAGMMISNLLAASIQDKMKKSNPEGKIGIINRVKGPMGERVWGGTGFGGLFLFPKSSVKTEEELHGILAFFDKTLSEDVNNLITYGIKGRHYSLLINGRVKIAPDTKEMRGQEVEPYANALRTFDVSYLKLSELSAFQDEISLLTEDNEAIAVPDLSAALISPTQAERGAELAALITDATYSFILGQLDGEGFDRELEKWKQNGGLAMMEELNQSYSESQP